MYGNYVMLGPDKSREEREGALVRIVKELKMQVRDAARMVDTTGKSAVWMIRRWENGRLLGSDSKKGASTDWIIEHGADAWEHHTTIGWKIDKS